MLIYRLEYVKIKNNIHGGLNDKIKVMQKIIGGDKNKIRSI